MLNNFRYYVETEILFGKGQVGQLPNVLRQYGKRVLLTYGGGSIKRNGLYDTVIALLSDFQVLELGGIEPNPKIESVYAGAQICKEHQIDVILAVGGGSTIDCSKAIAAAAFYEGDAWELINHAEKMTKALPLCTILTIAATGSEMDIGGAVTNQKTRDKVIFKNENLLPKTSILDPENTFTVSERQTAAGMADIMSHLLEEYFCRIEAFIPDRINEGLLKTVIKYGPIALKEPANYEARAQLMWASTLALNGICDTGKRSIWSCHPIEKELNAYYDTTHGIGLAIITPRWMHHILNDKTVDKFTSYAVNVWGIDPGMEKFELAKKGIEATEMFFKQCGIPTTLQQLGIDDEYFKVMATNAVKIGNLANAYVPLDENDVVNILNQSLK